MIQNCILPPKIIICQTFNEHITDTITFVTPKQASSAILPIHPFTRLFFPNRPVTRSSDFVYVHAWYLNAAQSCPERGCPKIAPPTLAMKASERCKQQLSSRRQRRSSATWHTTHDTRDTTRKRNGLTTAMSTGL